MVTLNEAHREITNLRGMLVALVVAYAFAFYVERHPHELCVEAAKYHQLVYLAMSGFDMKFGLQKLSWIIGNGFGMLGVILMFIRSRHGTPFLFLSPVLLGLAVLLGAPEPSCPDIAETREMLLWLVTSAIWGGVIVYAHLLRGQLFPRPQSSIQWWHKDGPGPRQLAEAVSHETASGLRGWRRSSRAWIAKYWSALV